MKKVLESLIPKPKSYEIDDSKEGFDINRSYHLKTNCNSKRFLFHVKNHLETQIGKIIIRADHSSVKKCFKKLKRT